MKSLCTFYPFELSGDWVSSQTEIRWSCEKPLRKSGPKPKSNKLKPFQKNDEVENLWEQERYKKLEFFSQSQISTSSARRRSSASSWSHMARSCSNILFGLKGVTLDAEGFGSPFSPSPLERYYLVTSAPLLRQGPLPTQPLFLYLKHTHEFQTK